MLEAPQHNRDRLAGFVSQSVAIARTLGASAPDYLRKRAELVRSHLAQLQAGKRSPHLQGLTAFDLSDAAEALDAEVVRHG